MGKKILCHDCGSTVEEDEETSILSRKFKKGFFHLCGDCFDERACKDVRKCPKCFEWHDDPKNCPNCGAFPANVNKVIHEE